VKVCFSGNGRKSGHLNGFILTLKLILDEKDAPKFGTKFVFPIDVAQGREKYENVECLMEKLTPLLQLLQQTTFDNDVGVDKYTFCSDGKFLLLMLGMCGASGTCSCPFCLLPSSLWPDAISGKVDSKRYLRKSVTELGKFRNPEEGCPVHSSTEACLKNSKTMDHGIKRKNLLAGLVEMDDIIIDELHFFLREFDLLENVLLRAIETFELEEELEKACH
jgi:hypothetical protein